MAEATASDWALGLQARSRALLTEGREAEEFYQESIEHLGRTRIRAELARAHDIALVLSSVTPVNNYTPVSQRFFADRPPSEILRLNEWMKAYCASTNCYYLDYFNSMVDGSGLLKRGLSEDGLHPNDAGYKIMAPLAEQAIAKSLAGKP